MTDTTAPDNAPTPASAPVIEPVTAPSQREDTSVAIAVSVLYLLPFFITPLVGLILAYVSQEKAGPLLKSHYTFQIRSFWLLVAGLALASVVFVFSVIPAIFLVGIPSLMLSFALLAALPLLFLLRTVVGLVFLAKGEPYPRPLSWVI